MGLGGVGWGWVGLGGVGWGWVGLGGVGWGWVGLGGGTGHTIHLFTLLVIFIFIATNNWCLSGINE